LDYHLCMAWDTEATRRKLLEAATGQFAALGLAGSRVDAIARAAGVNKERIYQYFGDKLSGIVIVGEGADALGRLAGDLHDRAAQDPQLARLLAWEGLELDEPVSAEARASGCASMVGELNRALPDRDREYSAELLLSLVAITTADGCLPHLARLISPASTRESRRVAIVAQARTLA
jgi:AcrR family transcriptional regulator